MVRIAHLAVLALTAVAGACVTGTYERDNLNEPRPDELVQPLLDGSASLQECLDALGAPNLVWPTEDEVAMAWAHTHERGWGVRVAYTIERVTASVRYNSALAKAQALALFFDDEWNLLYLRRGKLADLLEERPRRVQPVPPPEERPEPTDD